MSSSRWVWKLHVSKIGKNQSNRKKRQGTAVGLSTPGQPTVLPPAGSFFQPGDNKLRRNNTGKMIKSWKMWQEQWLFLISSPLLTLYTRSLLERLIYITSLQCAYLRHVVTSITTQVRILQTGTTSRFWPGPSHTLICHHCSPWPHITQQATRNKVHNINSANKYLLK